MASKLTQAEKQRRAGRQQGWDEAANTAVALLMRQHEGFKGKVSYLIAAEILRVDLESVRTLMLGPRQKPDALLAPKPQPKSRRIRSYKKRGKGARK